MNEADDVSYVAQYQFGERWYVLGHVHSTIALCREEIEKDTRHKDFRIKVCIEVVIEEILK